MGGERHPRERRQEEQSREVDYEGVPQRSTGSFAPVCGLGKGFARNRRTFYERFSFGGELPVFLP